MKVRFVLLLLSALTLPLAADVNQALDFESRLEQRVHRLVRIVDPDAHVLVRVKLKEVEVELPGMSSDFFGSTAINKIVQDDINSIKVKIISGLNPFPEAIKNEIKSEISFGRLKGDLEIVPFDDSTTIVTSNPTRIIDQLIQKYSGALYTFLMGAGILFAVVMAFAGMIALWIMSFWRKQVSRLSAALSTDRDSGPQTIEASGESRLGPNEDAKADGQIELPPNGLVEIFADCYWTEEDPYARWLWDNLSGAQRERLVAEWPRAIEYAKFLTAVTPKPAGIHSHPYYLNPISLRDLSQTDLVGAIKKRRELWSAISPLRRENLTIPLSEKLSLGTAKKSSASNFDPSGAKKSDPRLLPDHSGFGRISIEDELEIWNNPDLVPNEIKGSIVSLVWVAKLPQPDREKLLGQFSAADLARCWTGPEPVLNAIQQAIPDKKQKLLLGYRQTTPANRKSDAFVRLSKQAVSMLVTTETKDSDAQKVA